jgi:secondary thiamine-phosphate synthase enzyme
MLETLAIPTRSRTGLLDVTARIQQIVRDSGVQQGMCYLYVPHTTAGVTINENADSSVQRDMVRELNTIVPFEDGYDHDEGNSAAHIKSSMFGNSLFVFVANNALVLGTWQGIYFCEWDGPRQRTLYVKVVPD